MPPRVGLRTPLSGSTSPESLGRSPQSTSSSSTSLNDDLIELDEKLAKIKAHAISAKLETDSTTTPPVKNAGSSNYLLSALSVFVPLLTGVGNGYAGPSLMGVFDAPDFERYFTVPSPLWMNLLNNAPIFGALLAIPPSIWGSIHAEKRNMLVVGSLVMIMGSWLQFAAPAHHMVTFFVSRIIMNFGSSIAMAIAPALASERVPRGPLRDAIGPLNTCIFISAMALSAVLPTPSRGPVLGLPFWKFSALVQAAIPSIQIVLIYLTPPSPRCQVAAGDIAGATETLLRLGATPVEADEEIATLVDEVAKSPQASFRRATPSILNPLKFDFGSIVGTISRRQTLFLALALPVVVTHVPNHAFLQYGGKTLEALGWAPLTQHVRVNGCNVFFHLVLVLLTASGQIPRDRTQAFAKVVSTLVPILVAVAAYNVMAAGVLSDGLWSTVPVALALYMVLQMAGTGIPAGYWVADTMKPELEVICGQVGTGLMLVTMMVNGVVNPGNLGSYWPRYVLQLAYNGVILGALLTISSTNSLPKFAGKNEETAAIIGHTRLTNNE